MTLDEIGFNLLMNVSPHTHSQIVSIRSILFSRCITETENHSVTPSLPARPYLVCQPLWIEVTAVY